MAENKIAAKRKCQLVIDHQTRRLNLVQRYKIMMGCFDCGENDIRCLELHHLNPKMKHPRLKKYRTRGGLAGLSYKEIVAEINKCIVLCSNCHRKREVKPLKQAPPLRNFSPQLAWAEEKLGLNE
jgi:hypothetical protein